MILQNYKQQKHMLSLVQYFSTILKLYDVPVDNFNPSTYEDLRIRSNNLTTMRRSRKDARRET